MRSRPGFGDYAATRKQRLLRTAYLLCRDWGNAEDLVQTALTKAWVAWPRIHGDPDPFVYRVLVNTHASWWRRRWHREVPTGQLPERGAEGPAPRVADKDMLWSALGHLGRRERAAVVLRYFDDLTHDRIAEILVCSPGTVRSRIHRALGKLRIDPVLAESVGSRGESEVGDTHG